MPSALASRVIGATWHSEMVDKVTYPSTLLEDMVQILSISGLGFSRLRIMLSGITLRIG